MSSQQHAVFVDTILALNRAVKRKAYESDSDSSIEHTTNRGYKLKKRARYVHQGQLAGSAGPAIYREMAELSGYHRPVISRNPPLVDEDGYELDSEDDDERVQEAVASAADENPYASVRLEQILAPLTAITDLPTHPTLSRPFTSKALTELTTQGSALMHKENAALWKVKPLLTKLCGDHTWVPCELMTSVNDHELFSDEHATRGIARQLGSSTKAETATPNLNGESVKGYSARAASAGGRSIGTQPEIAVFVADSNAPRPAGDAEKKAGMNEEGEAPVADPTVGQAPPDESEQRPELNNKHGDGRTTNGVLAADGELKDSPNNSGKQGGSDNADGQPRDPGAGGEYQGSGVENVVDNDPIQSGSRPLSTTPDTLDELFIHPLFLAPRSAQPNRDLGLPDQEAEDVRRLVQLYVQKQEEVCRGTTKLYEGLLKADRLRGMVLKWAKAEAHCGANRDMSDGEDWYDKEEWGLAEDLKKGQDEEEEDTAQTQKKTRNRR